MLLTATASGSAPITRVDFYNSGSLIASVTNGPYSLVWSNVANSSYAYQITARATDSAGLVGYATASVRVDATPPPNDDFANALSMTGTNVTVLGTTAGASYESGEPYHGGCCHTHSVWWSWTAPANGRVTLRTTGVTYSYPVLGVYTGSSVSNLSQVSSGRYTSSGNYDTCTNSFDAVTGTTYRIAVDGGSSSAGPVSLNLNFVATVPPSNDNFVNRIPIVGSLPQVITGSNRGASAESGEPAHAGYSASWSLWWSWTAPQSGSAIIECWGAQAYSTWAISTRLAVYTGNAVTSLTPVANDDPDVWGFPSLVQFAVAAGNTYQIAVDTSYYEGDLRLLLTTNAPPTVTLTNPTNGARFIGPTNLFLSATASGPAPITKVDFYNSNTLIGSATNGPYSLLWSNVANSDYSYPISAYATDSAGLVGYATANVTVTVPPPPNDNFANRIPILGTSVVVTGTNSGATYESGEPYHAGRSRNRSIWWSWTAPANGSVALSAAGVNNSYLVMGVYTGTAVSSLTSVSSAIYGGSPYNACGTNFTVVAGVTYQIAVADWNQSGTITLALNFTASTGPPNDNFANRTVLSGASVATIGSNVGATRETGEPYHWETTGGKSVWWSWTAPKSGTVTISTGGSVFDTILAVYTGSSVSVLSRVANNDDYAGNYNSQVTFTATSGVTYQIAVDGYAADAGPISLSISQP